MAGEERSVLSQSWADGRHHEGFRQLHLGDGQCVGTGRRADVLAGQTARRTRRASNYLQVGNFNVALPFSPGVSITLKSLELERSTSTVINSIYPGTTQSAPDQPLTETINMTGG